MRKRRAPLLPHPKAEPLAYAVFQQLLAGREPLDALAHAKAELARAEGAPFPTRGAPPGSGLSPKQARLIRELEKATPEARLQKLRRSRQHLRGQAVAEEFLRRAQTALPENPEESATWGEAAARVAGYGGPDAWEDDDPRLVALEVMGICYMANAARIRCDFEAAEAGFQQAGYLISELRVTDLEAQGLCSSFYGSFAGAQRKFHRAAKAFENSLQAWRQLGDLKREAQSWISLGIAHSEAGRANDALVSYRQGAALAEAVGCASLAWMARYNEADTVSVTGTLSEAKRSFAAIGPHPDLPEVGSPSYRLMWLEARIAARSGEREQAEESFRTAQQGFLEHRLPFQAALVALERALLLLEGGRWGEVRALAAEVLEAFRALGVHREAFAAWRLFHEACEREAAGAALVVRLKTYLRGAERDPGFVFSTAE